MYDAACPSPDPYTVTLTDPVPAIFDLNIMLSNPKSDDIACVIEPAASPTVIDTDRLLRATCPVIQLADVSDTQSVASQAVWPALAAPVYDAIGPSPDPYTVTLDEPVPATLALCSTLAETVSSDIADVTDPARSPTVNAIAARRLP